MRTGLGTVLCLWASSFLAAALRAEEAPAPAATLLGPSTVLLVEVPRPAALLETVYAHPVAKRIESAPEYQQALQNPQLVPLRAGVAFVEFGMQMNWREILSAVTDGGLCLAVDGETNGVALLVQARDAETLTKFRNVLLNLSKDRAKNGTGNEAVKQGEYRGIEAFEVGSNRFATFGPWLLVTNNADLGQKILDRYLDKASDHLASTERYQKARAEHGEDVVAWGYIDVEQVRARISDANNPLLTGKAENPGVEILVGGILANLKSTPYATAAVQLDDKRLRLVLQSPHDPSWVPEEREYYFGPGGQGQAPRPLQLPETIATVSAYRDFSAMWVRAGDLFNQEINDKFAEAEANLSTLFSGRDFGEDILGSFEPQVQLLVVRQSFAETGPVPTIKLPSFALVAVLKEPEKMQRDFRRIFQNLVGFLNIVGAMNGQPQLDLDMDEVAGHQLITSTYAPEVDQRPGSETRIHYNFSPTLGFVGPHVVIASTTPLARSITEQLAGQQNASPALDANASVEVRAVALRDILQDNFGQLVAQNVLEKGHAREQAEKEIKGLLDLLTLFQNAQLRFAARDQLQLAIEFQFAE